MTTEKNIDEFHFAVVNTLNYGQLEELIKLCEKRKEGLRTTEIQRLSEQFNQMAIAEVGLTASTVLQMARKGLKATTDTPEESAEFARKGVLSINTKGNGADHQT